MGMLKRYLENFVGQCSDQATGQDAVLWAVQSGRFKLSFTLDDDLTRMMGSPDPAADVKEEREYDRIITEYQAMLQTNRDALVESYEPLFEQIHAPLEQAA